MTQSKVYKLSTISCYIIRSRRKDTEEEGERGVGMGRKGGGGHVEEKKRSRMMKEKNRKKRK